MNEADFQTWWDQQKAPAVASTPEGQAWLDQQKAITAGTFDAKANPGQVLDAPTESAADRGMEIFHEVPRPYLLGLEDHPSSAGVSSLLLALLKRAHHTVHCLQMQADH